MFVSDPDSPMKPGAERCRQEDTESSPTPALERLWTFTCELSKGRSVSSMAWNTKNPVTQTHLLLSPALLPFCLFYLGFIYSGSLMEMKISFARQT